MRPHRNLGDRFWAAGLVALGGGLAVVAGVIVLELGRLTMPLAGRVNLLDFLKGQDWDPVALSFGALPFIYGTLVTSLLALLVALPVSVGLAIFLVEMAPARLRPVVTFLIETLAAIPSVVYGLWGLFVLVPWLRDSVEPALAHTLGFLPLFQGPTIGLGFLAAGLILAVMILPTIASVTIEVLKTVPVTLREAALALGATRWEAIRLAVLPYARAGIVGATLLGLGRALGETMAVTMVIGNTPGDPRLALRPRLLAAGGHRQRVRRGDLRGARGRAGRPRPGAVRDHVLLNAAARLLVQAVKAATGSVG